VCTTCDNTSDECKSVKTEDFFNTANVELGKAPKSAVINNTGGLFVYGAVDSGGSLEVTMSSRIFDKV
jgi:hypothetical protein